MKTKLLLFFAFISFSLFSQTTHQYTWANDGSDAGQQITIEVGDTVEWTWGSGTHNLVTTSGTETIDSGYHGVGYVFSYTFNELGATDYECSPHAGNMYGTVTVEEASATTPAVEFIGVIDATVPSAGNNGKALHLLVNEDIADLSAFSLITHSNGNSSDTQTNFPSTGSISAGSHILVHEV